MVRILRVVILTLSGVVVAACAADTAPDSSDVVSGTYACDGGKSFTFTTERGSSVVTLELDGRSYQLEQLPRLETNRTQFSDGTLTLSSTLNGRFAALDGTSESYENCEAVAWERGGVVY